MHLRRLILSTLAAIAFAPALTIAQVPPLRLLVGFPAGGSADVTARVLADKMKDSLGVPVVVENRPGAGGQIAARAVKDAAPDGNTLMLVPFAVMVIQPMVFSSVKYDTSTDFTAVGNTVIFPLAVAVGPATPARNLRELTDWFKANADKANFGSPAVGSMPHFLGELLSAQTGVKLTHVAYQGGAPMVVNLLGGQIAMGIDTPAEFAEHHRAGKLRVIATSGAQRAVQFPDVATLREQGVDVDASAWFGLFGPAGMPSAVTDRLNAALQSALKAPDVIERLGRLGLTTAPGSPADMAQRLARDKTTWAPAIKASGFKAD
ncbi:MAG: Bug family tripartite tricarboxylate transporter substrate binding protein [Burkholderiaceae bacterium]